MNNKIKISELKEAIKIIRKDPNSKRIFHVKTKDGLMLEIQITMPKIKKAKSTWSNFTMKQFFSGYSKTDSIYDNI